MVEEGWRKWRVAGKRRRSATDVNAGRNGKRWKRPNLPRHQGRRPFRQTRLPRSVSLPLQSENPANDGVGEDRSSERNRPDRSSRC